MSGEWDGDRTVLSVSGKDARKFLQDLVTNDVNLAASQLVYAALLSPKGKYLFDFFLFERDGGFFLDVNTAQAPALAQRLTMYKLRADLTINQSDLLVNRGLNTPPSGSYADPRHSVLGWRDYSADKAGEAQIDWDRIRVDACIPETGVELKSNESYILECGFEALNGVDFRKGCYVGQEVTARMKHKTELRKGLRSVRVEGQAEVGTTITGNGKALGQLYTQSGGKGIAYLRLDRLTDLMKADEATVSV